MNKSLTSIEKAELLKSSIYHLYSHEGRSVGYISRLLGINRKTISDKIKEWNLPEAEPRHHLSPSEQKFLNKNRNLIKSRLDNNIRLIAIAAELKVSPLMLLSVCIKNDAVLSTAYENSKKRRHADNSNPLAIINPVDLDDEHWKPVLGYDNYFVSDKCRVKFVYHDASQLVKVLPNEHNKALYVYLIKNGIPHALRLDRLVAHAFVDGYDTVHTCLAYKDHNPKNIVPKNLIWVEPVPGTASRKPRKITRKPDKNYDFVSILYRNRYEFKTIRAFAKFLNKSETEIRQYLDEPDKHDIKLINNCND